MHIVAPFYTIHFPFASFSKDPFGEKRGIYDFASIQKRLEVIKQKLEIKSKQSSNGATDEDSTSENENAES